MWKSIAAILGRIGAQFGASTGTPPTLRNAANVRSTTGPRTEARSDAKAARERADAARSAAEQIAIEVAKEEAEAARASHEARDAEADAAKLRAQTARVRLKEARLAAMQALNEARQANQRSREADEAAESERPARIPRKYLQRAARRLRKLRGPYQTRRRKVAIRRQLQSFASRGSAYLRHISKKLPLGMQGVAKRAAAALHRVGSNKTAGRATASRIAGGLAGAGRSLMVGGAAAGAAVSAVAGIVMLGASAAKAAQAINEVNRGFVQFNGQIAVAFARLDHNRIIRSRASGSARAGSAVGLTQAIDRMEAKWRPTLDAIANGMNHLGAGIANLITASNDFLVWAKIREDPLEKINLIRGGALPERGEWEQWMLGIRAKREMEKEERNLPPLR